MSTFHRLVRFAAASSPSSSSPAAATAVCRRALSGIATDSPAADRIQAGFARGTGTGAHPVPHPRRDRTAEERNVQWVFLGCPGVGKGTFASRLSKHLGVPHISTGDLVREELASSGSLSQQLSEIVNQGKLVSDEIIVNLLSKRLENGQAKGESGFILDGFPRTVRQALSIHCSGPLGVKILEAYTSDIQFYEESRMTTTNSGGHPLSHKKKFYEECISCGQEILGGVTDVDLVINLKLREDVLVEKCLGRRMCSQCGGNFNIASINVNSENGRPGMYMAPLLPPEHCMPKLVTRVDDTEEVVKERLRIYNELSQPVEDYYRGKGKLLEFDLPGGVKQSWPELLRALNIEDDDYRQSAAA